MDLLEFLQIQLDMNRAVYDKLVALEQLYLNLNINNSNIDMKINIITIEKEKLNGEGIFLRQKLDSFKKPSFKV